MSASKNLRYRVLFGGPAIHVGSVTLRPQVAPCLLLSENQCVYLVM